MTNEEKAKRLEEIIHQLHDDCTFEDAALLHESAALWREREKQAPIWQSGSNGYYRESACWYKGYLLNVLHKRPRIWLAIKHGTVIETHEVPTLDAAKAAAVAWVDQQEGK